MRKKLAPVLSNHKPAKASGTWSDEYSPEKAFDDDTETRWGVEPNSRSSWLEVDLGEETPISKVVIMEIEFPRMEQYRIEVKEGINGRPLPKEKISAA